MCHLSFTGYGPQSDCAIFRTGLNPGFLNRCSALVYHCIGHEECLGSEEDDHVHIFVADVVKYFDTVDRDILDCVLGMLGLPGWLRHVYFEFHADVSLRFKFAAGIGEAWTRDCGLPQGCPLSMIFTVALYLPWCKSLEAIGGIKPHLYVDDSKRVSGNSDALLDAARSSNRYIFAVGQNCCSHQMCSSRFMCIHQMHCEELGNFR